MDSSALSTQTLRIRFCETDLMGIVHHANYLQYFEAGRVEWLRRRGLTYTAWVNRGLHLPVVEVQVRYRSPAFFDDLVQVETRLEEVRSHSVRFDYRVLRQGTVLTDGFTRLACVDGQRGLQPFPEDVEQMFLRGETEPPNAPESA